MAAIRIEGEAVETDDEDVVSASDDTNFTSEATAVEHDTEPNQQTIVYSPMLTRLRDSNLNFRLELAQKHIVGCNELNKKHLALCKQIDGTQKLAITISENLRKTTANLQNVKKTITSINNLQILPTTAIS